MEEEIRDYYNTLPKDAVLLYNYSDAVAEHADNSCENTYEFLDCIRHIVEGLYSDKVEVILLDLKYRIATDGQRFDFGSDSEVPTKLNFAHTDFSLMSILRLNLSHQGVFEVINTWIPLNDVEQWHLGFVPIRARHARTVTLQKNTRIKQIGVTKESVDRVWFKRMKRGDMVVFKSSGKKVVHTAMEELGVDPQKIRKSFEIRWAIRRKDSFARKLGIVFESLFEWINIVVYKCWDRYLRKLCSKFKK